MFNRYIFYFLVLSSLIVSSWASIEPVCKWYGIAPFCFLGNSCPEDCSLVSSNDRGDGALCWISQKHYCCCVKRTIDSIINTIIKSK